MTKKALLFLNGEAPSDRLLRTADFSLPIFCADGAYAYLRSYCMPDVLIGDFDSMPSQFLDELGLTAKLKMGSNKVIGAKHKDELGEIKTLNQVKLPEIVSFGAEKDFTDGFLALKILLERGYDSIDIYGALGGRPDHEISNYLLLSLAHSKDIRAKFVTERFEIFLTDKTFTASVQKGSVVSLVPFTDKVHIISTKGLKYPIHDLVMSKVDGLADKNYIMGVSNCAESDIISYTIVSGMALIYLEKPNGR